MEGINLSKDITWRHSSMRYFNPGEHHTTRFCKDNVLLMVFDGVLRFSENGTEYEIKKGEYFIQKENCHQGGAKVSDAPKYLFVHFGCEWEKGDNILEKSGTFDVEKFLPYMKEMDKLSYDESPYIIKMAKFLEILSMLYKKEKSYSIEDLIADFIKTEYKRDITLEEISEKFNFSKNHIINIFKKKYNMTPFNYLNEIRIKEAERLLETTSNSIDDICALCGYNNYSHFFRLFKEKNGVSPVLWRKKKRH